MIESRANIQDQALTSDMPILSDDTLIRFINDGQREANTYAWLLTQRSTFTLTSGTTEYSLPADFVATTRVMFKKTGQNGWVQLQQTSFNQLDADSAGWMGISAGTPYKYYIYLATAPVIGFVPAPAAVSTGTVQMDYIGSVIDVSTTSITNTGAPFNGFGILYPYHAALVYYVDCRALKMLSKADLAQPYCDLWLNSISLMKTGILKQPDFNPGFGGRRNQ